MILRDITKLDVRGIALYIAIAFMISMATVLTVKSLGGFGTPWAALIYVVMFAPAIAAATTRVVRHDGFADAGLRLGSWRWWLVAWGLSVIMVAATYALAGAAGHAHFELSTAHLAMLAPGSNVQSFHPPSGLSERHFLLLAALANLTVMNIPGLLLGFGEEFGWRGYLLPRLLPLGVAPALILSGVIWVLWHLPLALLTQSTIPVALAVPAALIGGVAYGAVLAWLRYASGSIIPPALCHIAFNNGNSAAVLLMRVHPPAMLISLVVVVSLAAGIVWWRGGLRTLRPGSTRGAGTWPNAAGSRPIQCPSTRRVRTD